MPREITITRAKSLRVSNGSDSPKDGFFSRLKRRMNLGNRGKYDIEASEISDEANVRSSWTIDENMADMLNQSIQAEMCGEKHEEGFSSVNTDKKQPIKKKVSDGGCINSNGVQTGLTKVETFGPADSVQRPKKKNFFLKMKAKDRRSTAQIDRRKLQNGSHKEQVVIIGNRPFIESAIVKRSSNNDVCQEVLKEEKRNSSESGGELNLVADFGVRPISEVMNSEIMNKPDLLTNMNLENSYVLDDNKAIDLDEDFGSKVSNDDLDVDDIDPYATSISVEAEKIVDKCENNNGRGMGFRGLTTMVSDDGGGYETLENVQRQMMNFGWSSSVGETTVGGSEGEGNLDIIEKRHVTCRSTEDVGQTTYSVVDTDDVLIVSRVSEAKEGEIVEEEMYANHMVQQRKREQLRSVSPVDLENCKALDDCSGDAGVFGSYMSALNVEKMPPPLPARNYSAEDVEIEETAWRRSLHEASVLRRKVEMNGAVCRVQNRVKHRSLGDYTGSDDNGTGRTPCDAQSSQGSSCLHEKFTDSVVSDSGCTLGCNNGAVLSNVDALYDNANQVSMVTSQLHCAPDGEFDEDTGCASECCLYDNRLSDICERKISHSEGKSVSVDANESSDFGAKREAEMKIQVDWPIERNELDTEARSKAEHLDGVSDDLDTVCNFGGSPVNNHECITLCNFTEIPDENSCHRDEKRTVNHALPITEDQAKNTNCISPRNCNYLDHHDQLPVNESLIEVSQSVEIVNSSSFVNDKDSESANVISLREISYESASDEDGAVVWDGNEEPIHCSFSDIVRCQPPHFDTDAAHLGHYDSANCADYRVRESPIDDGSGISVPLVRCNTEQTQPPADAASATALGCDTEEGRTASDDFRPCCCEPIHMSIAELQIVETSSNRYVTCHHERYTDQGQRQRNYDDFDKGGVCDLSAINQTSGTEDVYHVYRDGMKQLKDCGWYWGPLSIAEAELKLCKKPDGAFLVRDSHSENYILSLSFRSEGRIHHMRIEHNKGNFAFWSQPESHGRSTIKEFIDQVMENSRTEHFRYFHRAKIPGTPPVPIYLLYPVSRFLQVTSLQHICRFAILENVRRDHIHDLPVPPRIQTYLKQTQYYVENIDEDANDVIIDEKQPLSSA